MDKKMKKKDRLLKEIFTGEKEQVKKKSFTIVFQGFIAIVTALNPRLTITGRGRKQKDMKSFL